MGKVVNGLLMVGSLYLAYKVGKRDGYKECFLICKGAQIADEVHKEKSKNE